MGVYWWEYGVHCKLHTNDVELQTKTFGHHKTRITTHEWIAISRKPDWNPLRLLQLICGSTSGGWLPLPRADAFETLFSHTCWYFREGTCRRSSLMYKLIPFELLWPYCWLYLRLYASVNWNSRKNLHYTIPMAANSSAATNQQLLELGNVLPSLICCFTRRNLLVSRVRTYEKKLTRSCSR